MNMQNKVATVFGGTGFVGRQIVRQLARQGVLIKVATRYPASAYFLRVDGNVGQIVPVACDYRDEKSIAAAICGSDYVVNCVGILSETKKNSFSRVHVDLPKVIATMSAHAGVQSLLHISALGAEIGSSRYAKSKLAGEQAVSAAFPSASIFRPSVVFGEDDDFFNKFAEMARYLPFLPLIGGGTTKFQPVYVGDIAEAAMRVLSDPRAHGHIFELGGPEILTLKDIYERLFYFTNRKRPMVRVPFGLAKMQAWFMGMLPKPPLTPDQVESLKKDSVVKYDALGFDTLGLMPTGLNSVLPRYLETYRPGGRFAPAR